MKDTDFTDFDAFAASVTGVDCSMMLQNPRRRIWSIRDVALGAIRVQSGQLGSGNIVEGQSHADKYMLYMPMTKQCTYSVNGIVINADEFGILEPGCEFCVSTKHEHDWYTVVVPANLFEDGSNSNESAASTEKARGLVTRANRQLANKFRHVVHQIQTTAAVCPTFESELAAKRATTVLSEVASAIVGLRLAAEPHAEGRPRVPRKDIIDRCIAFLEARHVEPVLVGELVTAAGVSERTLRRAFIDYFNVGPIHYLQLRQLHRINRALRAADPNVHSVTDLLVQHGEWEFGRFAARYRCLFGERPSETLRAKTNRRR